MYPFWIIHLRLPTQRLVDHYLFECGAIVSRFRSWSESTPGQGVNAWERYFFESCHLAPRGETLYEPATGDLRESEKDLPTDFELTVIPSDKTPAFLACETHWLHCKVCNPQGVPILYWKEPE